MTKPTRVAAVAADSADEILYRARDVLETKRTMVGCAVALLLGTGCPAESDGGEGELGSTGADEQTSGDDPSSSTMNDPSGGEDSSSGGSGAEETSAGEESSGAPVDPSGGEICGTVPERMLVFGDSLFACYGQDGGKNGQSCSARLAHEYLAENYASEVSYENLAVSGAVTADVVSDQMPGAAVGVPGHALIVIWVGGNDISSLLLASDMNAETMYYEDLAPQLETLWTQMFAWIDDPANFPDGATVIVNTQFNPFDDCTAAPYGFMSPVKTELLAEYNDVLRSRVESREDTYLADQFPVFLGHGHHYGTPECPHYTPDTPYWMLGGTDLVHPNGLGHVSIAGTLDGAIDEVFYCE